MNSRFSHLVWLGAGTASEPANLLNTAEQVTLIEAREAACELLRNRYTEPNINIKQQLIDVASEHVQFTEYNLAEYSAVAPATGLKTLFPGLRKTGEEQLTSIAIGNVITDLHLSGTNNLLIIDIPDSNLALLQSLLRQHDYLSLFKNIYVHTALDPLYENSSTRTEIISFMQSTGYELLQENNQDPELPWLTFFVNPLWLTLQKTQQELTTERNTKENLAKELEKTKQELTAQQQAKDSLDKELGITKQDLISQTQAKELLSKELTKTIKELTIKLEGEEKLRKHTNEKINHEENIKQNLEAEKKQTEHKIKELELELTKKTETEKEISKLQLELDQLSKTATNRKDLVTKLEKENVLLVEENKKLARKQIMLEQELIKADAQITLIKDLFCK